MAHKRLARDLGQLLGFMAANGLDSLKNREDEFSGQLSPVGLPSQVAKLADPRNSSQLGQAAVMG
jgi:hypothetical protein